MLAHVLGGIEMAAGRAKFDCGRDKTDSTHPPGFPAAGIPAPRVRSRLPSHTLVIAAFMLLGASEAATSDPLVAA